MKLRNFQVNKHAGLILFVTQNSYRHDESGNWSRNSTELEYYVDPISL